MAAKIKLSHSAIRNLLNSEEVQRQLTEVAKEIAEKATSLQPNHANSTYDVEQGTGGGGKGDRSYAVVRENAPDGTSAYFNAINHTLYKALGREG